MTDDLMPQCLRRIQGSITESHGLLILDVSIVVLDGQIQYWNVNPTQYEPHNARQSEARAALLKQLIGSRSDGA